MGVATMTNRGLATIAGAAMTGATDIRQGVLTTAGTAPTVAAIRDMNFVSDLLAYPATEAAVAGYARADLASVTVTEDDTGDAVTITAAAPVYTAAAGETWRAVFYFIEAASDATRILLMVDTPTSTQVTNGGTITGPALLITITGS